MLVVETDEKEESKATRQKRGTKSAVSHEGGSKALLGGHTEGGGGEGVAWGLRRAERNNNL